MEREAADALFLWLVESMGQNPWMTLSTFLQFQPAAVRVRVFSLLITVDRCQHVELVVNHWLAQLQLAGLRT